MTAIDSSTWTGLPSEVRPAAGPYGEFMSEAEDAAMYRDECRCRRADRLRALAMLWGPSLVDVGASRARRDDVVVYRRQRGEEWTFSRALLATFAIVFNRLHGRREVVLHKRRTGNGYVPSLDLGYWDSHASGYGHSATCCRLYPGVRFEIFSDGESWM